MEFIDLKAQYEYLKPEVDKAVLDVMSSAHFIMGDEEKTLEHNLAEYTGRKHCIGCSDGTAALQLAFMAYGIHENSAVFCPAMTFIASIEPACLLGATPVFCDIDPISFDLDPVSLENQIKKVIEENKLIPKAVVAVDFVGDPADFDAISKICDKYDLVLIEDAAQGMGASVNGKKCCSFGDISCTSFFPTKPLGCYGDGGAVFTDDDNIDTLIRSLRVHGKGKTKYDNIHIGMNSRLDTIQAAVLNVKLAHLDEEIEKRQAVAEKYNKAFSGILKTPYIKDGCVSSYAQYIVTAKSNEQRQHILDEMKKNDVPSILYYPNPLHRLPVFENNNTYGEDLSDSEHYADMSFGLPFSPYLSDSDQRKVINTVLNALK